MSCDSGLFVDRTRSDVLSCLRSNRISLKYSCMPTRISAPSIQSLKVEPLARGNILGHATAFVAQLATGRPWLVTNRHVVTGRNNETGECLDSKNAAIPDTIRVWFWAHGQSHQVPVDIPLYSNGGPDDGGIERWVEHPSYRNGADVVALPLPLPDDIELRPYVLGTSVAEYLIEPSDHVQVIGFPLSEPYSSPFAIWVAGFVASEPELNHRNAPYFLIDCRARKGQSGSPVILATGGHGSMKHKDERHFNVASIHLIGIYSGRLGNDTDLGMVWKEWLLSELLAFAQSLQT